MKTVCGGGGLVFSWVGEHNLLRKAKKKQLAIRGFPMIFFDKNLRQEFKDAAGPHPPRARSRPIFFNRPTILLNLEAFAPNAVKTTPSWERSRI